MRGAVFPQLGPLVHAELVLLVDDDQAQMAKLDVLLEQGDGADDDVDLAPLDLGERLVAFLAGQAAGDEDAPDLAILEIPLDAQEVLRGENLRRRHDGGLRLVGDGQQSGVERDHGLAGADVALEQAVHRRGPAHVLGDLRDAGVLIVGEQERETPANPAVDLVGEQAWRGGGTVLRPVSAQAQSELHEEQLVVFEPAFGLVELLLVRRHVNPGERVLAPDADGPL